VSGPNSLRAAGHALVYWQRRQEVNSHNLANVETTGYQARRVFAELVEGGLPQLGTVVDRRGGDLRQTGGPLDLALVGDGHFVVQGAAGEQTVRSGSFTLDGLGQIVDEQGRPLMGEGGPLVLPPGPVEIDARGRVSVAGELVGRVRVVREARTAEGAAAPSSQAEVPDPDGPRPAASSSSDLEPLGEEDVLVRQGYLEGSNVSALDSLIEMTTIQRSFEAVQNSVQAIDSVMETVANRLGRLE
jgi:flagellar hook-basal body protein